MKLSYVEQINPLLSKKILQQVRQLPDHLRTGKVLFKKIVNSLSPAINYATSPSGAIPDEILKQQQIVNLIRNELSSDFAKTLFHSEFLDFVLTELKSKDQIEPAKANSLSIRTSIRKIVPRFV
ncbi:MAG: hypothetical protein NTY95_19030, partial [Bacteroidia bacterium]|nr:hypothetical protein [Bacteroidia bacterium]